MTGDKQEHATDGGIQFLLILTAPKNIATLALLDTLVTYNLKEVRSLGRGWYRLETSY